MTRLLTPLLLLALAPACNPDADGDGTKRKQDCDDEQAAASPDQAEICDGIDNDCDGEIDESDATDAATWYADLDDDGYGDAGNSVTACEQPDGYLSDADDCDDSDDAVSPDGTEVCGGGDEDCDGTVDEDDASDAPTWFIDSDSDGLGDATNTTRSCVQPVGTSTNSDDCDDAVALIGACCTEGEDDLVLTENATVPGGTYYLDEVSIPAGVTLRVTGTEPLVIFANRILVAGTIDLSGSPGKSSGETGGPSGGAAGPGGGGGGGGGDCGNGIGSGGAPNGGVATADGGRGGAGFGTEMRRESLSQGGSFGPGGGGGGGGYAVVGGNGGGFDTSFGVGGQSYGTVFLADGIYGGMGGAGGGANGGGGGGGGGVVIAHANSIEVSGVITARGGDGGGKTGGSCTSGGGGGGAGGAIWLQASVLDLSGILIATGGLGKTVEPGVVLNQPGGDGSPGRVRVSSPGLEATGTILSGSTDSDSLDPVCD